MKRFFAIMLSAMTMFSMFTACGTPAQSDLPSTSDTAEEQEAPDAPAVEEAKWPTASETADQMNLGINLGNTFEAYNADGCEKITYEWMPIVGNNTPYDYETTWGATSPTQASIDGMKAAGFDTLRIPVYWGNMMENDGTWTIHPDYIARVKEVVDYCQKADMYAVINIHHFDEFVIRRNDIEECERIFDILWTQIAEAFKNYDHRVVFEGFNEYLGGSQFDESGKLKDLPEFKGYALTNACNQAFVDAVRATGGNNAERVLIVSGYNTNIDRTTSDEFEMPKDTVADRLMVSVHYVDNNMYWSNSIGNQRWLDYIDDQCDKLERAFTSKGIPAFLGETTASYPDDRMAKDAKYKKSANCVEIVLEELYDRGFIAAIWTCYDDWYDRTNCKMVDEDYAKVVSRIAKKER